MAKGHRSQIKRARNENNRETRPSAKLSYARISVQKACYVLDAIRGKDVQTALGILTYNPRYASSVIKKLLESAVANAENNNGMNADNLYVAACYADKGPSLHPRCASVIWCCLRIWQSVFIVNYPSIHVPYPISSSTHWHNLWKMEVLKSI